MREWEEEAILNNRLSLASLSNVSLFSFIASAKEIQISLDTNQPCLTTCQPIKNILSTSRVKFVGSKQANHPQDIQQCIESLDSLITKLSCLDYVSFKMGTSPGFDTVDSALIWRDVQNFPHYETNDLALGLALSHLIRRSWVERLEWAEAKAAGGDVETICSCFGQWEHFGGSVLTLLTNQVIEQVMIREASACLRSNSELFQVWNEETVCRFVSLSR